MSARAAQRVFLVDDDEAVRDALQLLLKANGLQVQAFGSAEGFLDYYRSDKPGCLLLDIRMPGMSGLQLQEELLARRVRLPIIFITAHGDIPTAVDAVRKGAVQFIEKPFDGHRLLRLVFEALELDSEMRRHAAVDASHEARLLALTRRERQVLEKILAGKTNRAISDELFVSVKTVEFHRAKIMRKLQAGSIRQLFQMYLGSRIL